MVGTLDYKKIYDDLVLKCKQRGLDKKVLTGYYERHHILPRCLGGDNSTGNLVLFTAREHLLAHRLLWKLHPDNKSLMWAYSRTMHTGGVKVSPKEVERLKIAKAHHMSTRVVSQETKDKIRKTLTGHKRTKESIEKSSSKLIGRKHSPERIQKIKDRWAERKENGWTLSEEARLRIGAAGKGRKLTEEQKLARSLQSKGRKMSEACKAASKLYRESMRPWEASRVRASQDKQDKWKRCQQFYELWLQHNRCGYNALTSHVFAALGFSYKLHELTTIVEMFKSGWIPTEDSGWIDFRDNGYWR